MGMRDRCTNPNRREYKYYGGRGIEVCERWQVFENFLADMGERPSPSHSIDRIDCDGDYSPDNCRWATHREQLRNTHRNRWVTYDGKDWCVTDLALHLGVDVGTLRYRMRVKWPRSKWGNPPGYERHKSASI
jgi:hypothetical protein